jgi:anti-anti-sigma factor
MHLILDLTSVSFLDSGGVNAIAKTRTAVHAADGSLRLVCPHGSRARHVLHLTGLDQYLALTDTLTQALTSATQPTSPPERSNGE